MLDALVPNPSTNIGTLSSYSGHGTSLAGFCVVVPWYPQGSDTEGLHVPGAALLGCRAVSPQRRDACRWGAAVQRCTGALSPGTNSATKAQLLHQLGLHIPRCVHSTAWPGRHQTPPVFAQRENLRGITPWSSTARGALSNASVYHPASRCSFQQFRLIHQGASTPIRATLHTAGMWHGPYVFLH